ncbi:amino acid transporter [Colletotrichum caudatum]|nr:amino acid transporter [Colletotrichum caudatum]
MASNTESDDDAQQQQQQQQRPLLADTHHEYGGTDGPSPPVLIAEERGAGTFTRNLGAVEAFAIVISIVIGSGVFTSPGSIDTNVPSPGAALVVWLVGGVLAWTGASTMAELGTAIPGEGGVQPFLQHIYGDVFGFLAAWTWIVAVMPATLAILSIVFVESIYSASGVTDQASAASHKALSVLVLVVMNGANCISTKASTRLNNLFVVTKFAAILAVVLAGVVVVILQLSDRDRDVGGRDWFDKPWFGNRKTEVPGGGGSEVDWDKVGAWDMLGYYSAALYGALWAYSGWDKAIYVTAELQHPARQLPLAINTAVPTIILCFIAANAAYYILLPWDVVSKTDSVAVTAINRLLGSGFGIAAAVLICLVVAGSLLGNSFVAGRMTVAAANFNWLPGFLGFVGRVGFKSEDDHVAAAAADSPTDEEPPSSRPRKGKSDAPLNALLLSTVLSALYILLGNFRALLTFNGLGEYTFFFLTVLGAVVLRVREPKLRRPYKPSVLIPVVFALVSGFVVVRGAIFAPVQALILIVLWVVGLGFYWARRKYYARRTRLE